MWRKQSANWRRIKRYYSNSSAPQHTEVQPSVLVPPSSTGGEIPVDIHRNLRAIPFSNTGFIRTQTTEYVPPRCKLHKDEKRHCRLYANSKRLLPYKCCEQGIWSRHKVVGHTGVCNCVESYVIVWHAIHRKSLPAQSWLDWDVCGCCGRGDRLTTNLNAHGDVPNCVWNLLVIASSWCCLCSRRPMHGVCKTLLIQLVS